MKVERIMVLLAAGLVLLVLAGAGCGGGSKSKTSTTTTTPAQTTTQPSSQATTTSVSQTEYQFSPSAVTVKSGSTLTVTNDGKISHNLTVQQGTDPKKTTTKLIGTPTSLPGKTDKLKVSLKPGKYSMYCSVPGHRDLGMVGTFTVIK
jgi:uncharacterized cupredoxin-like copper-binding protein